jgi:hypothetical protein
MFEQFKGVMGELFGSAIPAQDLDFIASLMFVDFMDRFFNVALTPSSTQGGSGMGTGMGTGGHRHHRHQMMMQAAAQQQQ